MENNRNFKLIENELIISDKLNKMIWHGKPYGCPISIIIPMPKLSGCIVLLEYYEFSLSEYHGLGNLIFLNDDGKVTWHAELPESIDSYVYIKFDGVKLFANSWSGYLVQLNPINGKLLNKTFTK
jgi:hypothetical protein